MLDTMEGEGVPSLPSEDSIRDPGSQQNIAESAKLYLNAVETAGTFRKATASGMDPFKMLCRHFHWSF